MGHTALGTPYNPPHLNTFLADACSGGGTGGIPSFTAVVENIFILRHYKAAPRINIIISAGIETVVF